MSFASSGGSALRGKIKMSRLVMREDRALSLP